MVSEVRDMLLSLLSQKNNRYSMFNADQDGRGQRSSVLNTKMEG